MEKAINIAQSYLEENAGDALPLAIVADDGKGKTHAWLCRFREKHKIEDQNTFCGVIRVAFSIYNVAKYTMLYQSYMTIGTDIVPVITATEITRNTRNAKVFRVADDFTLTALENAIPANGILEGMFLELLPLRRKDIAEDKKQNICAYLNTISYEPKPKKKTVEPAEDGLEILFKNYVKS